MMIESAVTGVEEGLSRNRSFKLNIASLISIAASDPDFGRTERRNW